jgi:hypothetical protein
MKPTTSGDFDPYLNDWNKPDEPVTKDQKFGRAFVVGFCLAFLVHRLWGWLF